MQLLTFPAVLALCFVAAASNLNVKHARGGVQQHKPTTTSVCSASTITETQIATISYGITKTVYKTETEIVTYATTAQHTITQTATEYYTHTTTAPGSCATKPSCPTMTSTATYCKSCLVPDCTITSTVTKSCGCDVLPTAVVSFPCGDPDSCNNIGCKTAYVVQTARC